MATERSPAGRAWVRGGGEESRAEGWREAAVLGSGILEDHEG